jgi:hypothetical protein
MSKFDSLADQLADDVVDVFINTDDFALVATYAPIEGTPRAISVIVDRDQDAELSDDGDEDQIERVGVFCERHSVRGVDDPQIGDEITLPGETLPYQYSGEYYDADASCWWLRYWRYRPTGRGVGR